MKSSFSRYKPVAHKAALLSAVMLALGLSGTVSAADWNDTEIQFTYGTKFHEPFNPFGVDPSRPWDNDTDVKKYIITLQHASSYKYGSNFFFVDFLTSTQNDPIGGGSFGEVYSEWYTTLSLSKTTGTKVPWGDVGLTFGINYGAKSNGANPRVLLLGPTFSFNVPGFIFVNLDVLAYRDTGRFAGFAKPSDTTWQITPVWLSKFNIGQTKWQFRGHIDWIGKRCPAAGFCNAEAVEVLAQPELELDVGNFFGKPDTVYLGLEYQYWKNKFGFKGLNESHPQLQLSWKF